MIFKAIFAVFAILTVVYSASLPKKQSQCGKKIISFGTIWGGDHTSANSWPWLVAFRLRPNNTFFCGGSLVSAKHVITAAHCLQEKYKPAIKEPTDVIAYVGKHNLRIENEPGSAAHHVLDIIIHDNWDYNEDIYDADIAITVLETEVDLTNRQYVRIVCLPPASQGEVTGIGSVIGWGISARSVANYERFDTTPNELELPAVNQSYCRNSDELFLATSDRTFCAGYENQNKSICGGDSGGGFYVLDRESKVYNLIGIASSSLRDKHLNPCRTDTFSIFTNVGKFVDWIKQKMEATKIIEWEKIYFDCSFHDDMDYPHRCESSHTGNYSETFKVRQNYQNATTLEKLVMLFGSSERIFAGIGENFPKLKKLWIFSNGKIKFVEKQNFEKMENLEALDLIFNSIEILPGNVFDHLVNLRKLSVEYNEIHELPENLFYRMTKIEEISFAFNKIEVLHRNLLSKNVELKKFEIYGNPLRSIQVDISNLPKLKFYNETESSYYGFS